MCLYYLVSPEVAHSLLLPEATTLLSHSGAYSWPDAAIVTCGPRQQGFGLEVPAKPGTDGHTISGASWETCIQIYTCYL